jgi:hypothetical protein
MLAVILSSCSSTYIGVVVRRDGAPVAHAKIAAIDYPTLFNTPPWGLYPRWYERGTTYSRPDGSFTLQASSYRFQELRVTSPDGYASLTKPLPEKPLRIVVAPAKTRKRSNQAMQRTAGRSAF